MGRSECKWNRMSVRLTSDQRLILIEQWQHRLAAGGGYHEDPALDTHLRQLIKRGFVRARAKYGDGDRVGISSSGFGLLLQLDDSVVKMLDPQADRHPSVAVLDHSIKGGRTESAHQNR